MIVLNSHFSQRNFASIVLCVLLANLIIGGVLLPFKNAKAIPVVVVADPYTVWNTIQDWAIEVWDQIAYAYNAAASWISANIAVWQKMDTWYVRALKTAWDILRKKLLKMLVDDIVKWIQGGGKPKLVTNWQGFLRDAADKAGGQFVDEYLGMGFLCDRFDVKLKFALATVPTFDQAVRCPLSMMKANVDKFLQNFSNGGWKTWISLSTPQNNIYGAYLMALDKKIGVQSAAAEAAKNEATASSGFLGDKRCTSIYEKADPGNTGDFTAAPLKEEEIPAGWVCSKWTTYTPGKIAAEALAKAINLDIDWLISSKEFTEYAGAIIDAVVNRAIKEGVAYMTAPSGSSGQTGPGISTPATVSVNLSAYQDASQNSGYASALTDQLSLLSGNVGSYAAELQTNLNILNQIRNTQVSSLDILRQMIAASCSLPAGVTQTTLSTDTAGNCATTCPCTITSVATIRVDAPGTGSLVFQRTTTQTQDEPDFMTGGCIGTFPAVSSSCSMPTTCSTNTADSTISSAAAVDSEITNVNSAISAAQGRISQINTAVSDVQNYYLAAANYLSTYEASQQGGATSTEVAAAESAMWAAKSIALSSTQTAIGSSSSDFQFLLQETQNANLQVVQGNSDAQMKRGGISDCSFVQPGTYYGDLCNAQATYNNYNNAYSACLSASSSSLP